MRKLRYRSLLLLSLISAGTLFQSSCAQITAETIGGLSLSITNTYIRSVLSDKLGLTSGASLSSLLSLGSR